MLISLALSLVLGQADVARLSQLKLVRPTVWYVNAAGSDTRDCRSPARPCRTPQRACDQLPDDICDAAVIHIDGGTYAGGCRREGLRRCSHRGTDGGVVWGTLEITGQPTPYASGTITGVTTTGAMASCALEQWQTSSAPTLNEWQNRWIAVTSGTGSGTDRAWPVRSNTVGGLATLQAQGEITSHPVNGSGFTVYSAPATVISGNLGQVTTGGGPEGTGQASGAAAFIFSTVGGAQNGAASDRWITLQRLTTTGSVTLVRENGGSVTVREVAHQATGALARGLAGRVTPALERNILTAGSLLIARNLTFGADLSFGQVYNNVCADAVTTGILSSTAGAIWSQSNHCPKAQVRAGACDNCRSVGDAWGFVTIKGELDPATSPMASAATFSFDGAQLGDGSAAYVISVEGPATVAVDQLGGSCASTLTDVSHTAALSTGGRLLIAPGTTIAGAGAHDIVPTRSTGALTVATLRAMTPKTAIFWDLSMASESGGSFGAWTYLLSLASGTTLDGIQCDRAAATAGGVLAATFSPAFRVAPRSCWCIDENAAPVHCGISTAATTTGVTFALGAARADTVNWCCLGAR